MFYTIISKETLDAIMTLFFRNLGLVDPSASLTLNDLKIDGDEVLIEADMKEETLN